MLGVRQSDVLTLSEVNKDDRADLQPHWSDVTLLCLWLTSEIAQRQTLALILI